MNYIKEVYDKNFTHLKIDSRLCKSIINYDHQFVRKNQEHVDFFGSALIGTHSVIWGTDDRNRWIDDILQVDEVQLQQDIRELPADIYPVDPKTKKPLHKVATNFINLSFVYLAYRIQIEKSIPRSLKTDAIESIFRIMLYKFLTSLMSNSFKLYKADRRAAEAAYNELNDRFDLKRFGSWKALIDNRAKTLASNETIHKRTIESFAGDKQVKYVVTDIQTRIRRLFQAYFRELDKVVKSKKHLVTTSSMMDTEEGYVIKDVTIEQKVYYRYLTGILADWRSLKKDEILYPLLELNASAQPDKVLDILRYISDNARKKEVTELCSELLIYVFSFMKEKQIKTTSIATLAEKLKAMFTGSKIKTPEILSLREKGDALVRKGAHYSRTAPVSTERTVILLYLAVRALSRNHFR